jgi:predicted transcriptional regulator
MVLIEAEQPLNVREICARIEKRICSTLSRHKDPLASVTTVLNRLLRYGEVSAVANRDGGRAFQWVSEAQGVVVHRSGQSSVLIRPLTIGLADEMFRRCAK